jgi:hypothetical protein
MLKYFQIFIYFIWFSTRAKNASCHNTTHGSGILCLTLCTFWQLNILFYMMPRSTHSKAIPAEPQTSPIVPTPLDSQILTKKAGKHTQESDGEGGPQNEKKVLYNLWLWVVYVADLGSYNTQTRWHNIAPPPPPHSPLPKHQWQNEDPVGKHAKAAKVANAKAAKAAKASSKRQQEVNAKAVKDTLVEVEVNELFAQREETQWHIHHVSDIENVGASDDSDSNDESDEDEFPDLADMDLSSGDTEDSSNAPNDDKGPSQKPPKASSCSYNAKSDDPVLYPECKDQEKGSDQAVRSSFGKEKWSKGQRASQDSQQQVEELILVAWFGVDQVITVLIR